MANSTDIRPVVRLKSTAGTGYTYVTRKNRRNDPDRIVLRLAPRIDLAEEERRRLVDAMVPVLGAGVRFRIDVVSGIARGAGGKSRPIVSLLDRP